MKRRPKRVLKPGTDPRPFVGSFWELEDFRGICKDIFEMLEETKRLEEVSIDHVRKHNTFHGDQINEEGCRSLGIPEEKIREWIDGV
eukprot:3896081-Rhodomonas_salina.1